MKAPAPPNPTEKQIRSEIEDLLAVIVSKLVSYPETIKVSYSIGENTTTFYIDTDQRNIGQIIGARGRNINSLRTLVAAIAGRHNIRAIIEIPYFGKQSA